MPVIACGALATTLAVEREAWTSVWGLLCNDFRDAGGPLLAYLLALSLGVAALLVLARLGYGKRYLLVYLLLCSLISSVTVIAARAFSSHSITKSSKT